MDYTNEAGQAVTHITKSAEELDQVLSAEIAAHATTARRCEELQELLNAAQQSAEVEGRNAKRSAERLDEVAAFMDPLVAYIGQRLLESPGFIDHLNETVADAIQDKFEGRDFDNAVEEAVGNLSFEVTVR